MPHDELTATLIDLTAGTLGGCSGIVIGQPLDTVRVRLQSQETRVYKHSVDALLKITRQEGPRALFQGMTSPLVGNAPMNAVVFGAYGNAKRFLDDTFPRPTKNYAGRTKPQYANIYLAGAWAGALQSLVTSPVEMVKCRLQVQNNTTPTVTTTGTPTSANPPSQLYKGPLDCLRRVYATQGIRRGVFRGLLATFWRDSPTYGLYFCANEYVKWYLGPDDDSACSIPVQLLAGATAGVVSWLATYQFDIVKTIIQTLPEDTPKEKLTIRYQFRHLYQTHGAQFFFRGLGPTLIRAAPVNAVTLIVYENVRLQWGADP